MSRKNQENLLPSLLVQDGISMSLKHKRYFPERTIRLLVSLLGTAGTFICMQGFFSFPIPFKSFLLNLLVLALIIRVIRELSAKIGVITVLVGFLAVPVVMLRYLKETKTGIDAIYNIMRKVIMHQNVFLSSFHKTGEWSEKQCVLFVCYGIAAMVVLLIEYSDILLVHHRSARNGFLIRFLVTFPFLESGLYFGLETNNFGVFMLILFWIGSLVIGRAKIGGRHSVAVSDSPKRANSASNLTNSFAAHETAALLLVLAAGLVSIVAALSCVDYLRTDSIDQKRREIREAYQEFSMKDVTGLLNKLPLNGGMNVISDEIDLLQNEAPIFDGRTILHISMDTVAIPDDYYLKGTVRTEYTGHGWAMPTGVYRRYQSLFEQLAAANRMPQTLFHSDHAEELRTENGKFPAVRCRTQAFQHETCNYFPYQSIFDPGTRFRYDIETDVDSKSNYEYWLMCNAQADWDKFSATAAPSPDPLVSEYEDFVYRTYLTVPATDAMEDLFQMASPYLLPDSARMVDRLDAIRGFIWNRAEYTMSPGATPEDMDYVNYFLSTSHKGFCAHYASAAVLLCRMNGIPARYCQGYILTMSNFANGKEADSYEMDIPDYQAHAWAEVYVRGYGWVPYEFTETLESAWHAGLPSGSDATATSSEVTTTTATLSTPQSQSTTTLSSGSTMYDQTGSEVSEVSDVTTNLPPEEPHVNGKKILLVLGTLALLIAIPILYLRHHRRVLQKRSRAMRHGDHSRAADASYDFLIRLLQMQGIRQNKLPHEAFAALAEERCKLLEAGKITEAINTQQAVVFSRKGATKPQATELCTTAEQLAKAYYQQCKPLRKIWLRWFRHII